jgi:hypothetical protein
MKTFSTFGKFASVLAVMGAFATGAMAAPTPVAPPPALLDGFQVDWVQTDHSPHSIADAINALNGTGGFNTLNSATEFLTFVNLNDASVPGSFGSGDPLFAIRVTGFISIPTAGNYSLLSVHDDGIRVSVGGDQVIVFDSDTGAVETDSPFYSLAAGIYEYEAISWEQGGAFNLQLGIENGLGSRDFLAGQHASSVPEPLSLALVGAGLFGLASTRRKKAA